MLRSGTLSTCWSVGSNSLSSAVSVRASNAALSYSFALIKVGEGGGSIGLLLWQEALKEGVEKLSDAQKKAIRVELSTDDLDGVYVELKAKGVLFITEPHDEPWERAATAIDPDGYPVEFAQGKRGENAPKK